MDIDEFKEKLTRYESGKLTSDEAEKFENELEKLDEYQAFLEAKMDHMPSNVEYNPQSEKRILRRSQSFAYLRMGLVSLIIALLLLPTLNLFALVLGVLP